MKLGTLLATGKSLVLGRRGESPYRANKQVYLPKFGSRKNPFASANPSREAISPEEAAAAPVKTPITVVAAKTQKLPAFSPAQRAATWAGRLNPISIWRGPETPAPDARPAVQSELSLDAVKVLRNDLSDVDVEIVPLKSRPLSDGGKPDPGASKSAWGLLGERFLKMKAG